MKWKSLALEQPPIIRGYSAPVLVRVGPKEYFTAKFFRYENGMAVWKICYDDESMILATVDDYWMPTDEFEKDFEQDLYKNLFRLSRREGICILY